MILPRFLVAPQTQCRGPVTTRLSSRPDLTCSFTNQLPVWGPSLSVETPSQASSAADLR
jgi:hypothetical protein